MQAIAPARATYTDDVLFGDVWLRHELGPRDRNLVTLSTLIAIEKSTQLARHLNRGHDNGLKPFEICGIVMPRAFYTGWSNVVSAAAVIDEVFTGRKIDTGGLRTVAVAPGARRPAPGARRLQLAHPPTQATADRHDRTPLDAGRARSRARDRAGDVVWTAPGRATGMARP